MTELAPLRLALIWRHDPRGPGQPCRRRARLRPVADAAIKPVVYGDKVAAAVRDQVLRCAGAIVWVNPPAEGRDRVRLDAVLRTVTAASACISAHLDMILATGTKEMLVPTRRLGGGADTRLHASFEDWPGSACSS